MEVGGGCRNRIDDRSFAVTDMGFRVFQRVRPCFICGLPYLRLHEIWNTEERVYPDGFPKSEVIHTGAHKQMSQIGTGCRRLARMRSGGKVVNGSPRHALEPDEYFDHTGVQGDALRPTLIAGLARGFYH